MAEEGRAGDGEVDESSTPHLMEKLVQQICEVYVPWFDAVKMN